MSEDDRKGTGLTAKQIEAELKRTKKKRVFGRERKLPERIELPKVEIRNGRVLLRSEEASENVQAEKPAETAQSELESTKEKQERLDRAIEILAGNSFGAHAGENGLEQPEGKPPENVSYDKIEAEIDRVKHKKEFGRILRETVIILLGVAAVAVLVSMLFLPVLRVTGTSMEPTLHSDEIVVCAKNSDFKKGDIVAFYFNNKVLLKRVIGIPGDVVDIAENGDVTVNGEKLNEDYTENMALGETDLEFPVQVPESRLFVLGDNRETSVDSRSSEIGYIAEEYIIGRVICRVWPLGRIGTF